MKNVVYFCSGRFGRVYGGGFFNLLVFAVYWRCKMFKKGSRWFVYL